MNRIIRTLLIGIIIVIILLGIYITIDCIRLKNSSPMTKPLITLKVDEDIAEGGEVYTQFIGLGYNIKYFYIFEGGHEDGSITLEDKRAEFRLFNKLLLWTLTY